MLHLKDCSLRLLLLYTNKNTKLFFILKEEDLQHFEKNDYSTSIKFHNLSFSKTRERKNIQYHVNTRERKINNNVFEKYISCIRNAD